MSIVEIHHVSKSYGEGPSEVYALRDVSLSFEAGALTAIMGQSGSGKSTLLTIAGSLEEPTNGKVLVDGFDLSTMSRRPRPGSAAAPSATCFRITTCFLGSQPRKTWRYRWSSTGSRERKARIAGMDALEALGVAERAGRFPDELSEGERQRVSIARAIVGDRRVDFADETTGALDSANGEAVMGLILAACRRGAAAVMVAHDRQIASWADTVVFLRDGRTVDQAPAVAPITAGGAR